MSRWQRVGRFLQRRIDPKSEVGLRLTTSLVVLVACIWAFGGLLEDVLEKETLVHWDLASAQWFHTHQPSGVLHGGASVALAETVGSVAANLCVDRSTHLCMGQEINANHLRPVASGLVTATARPYHIGSRSQVWHIEIRDAQERLVCISRLTIAVLPVRQEKP